MQFIKPDVQTICVGIAMSMGSLLLAAGAKGKRMALPNSRILIHQPSGGFEGQSTDIEIHAREILALRARVDEIYAKHTGRSFEEVERNIIKELEYTQASRAMGAGGWHIIRRHVFPNSVSNIVTVATFAVADAILFLTTLGYLGLGIPAPATDWGTMLNNASQVQPFYWWQVYPLAVIFILVIVAITYIGEAMRDAFEVRLLER